MDRFTIEELEILCRDEVRRAIDENIGRDPVEIALDRRIPHAAAVASQVKRLQRAASKLPHYYAARAVMPQIAAEQSSSMECAGRKPLSGDSLLDLTCGLGVDSAAFAGRFRRVVALERDAALAAAARENFSRMGIGNVEVLNVAAEEYLGECTEHFDWCYADPDRRGADGRKLVLLQDCSPDVVALRGTLSRVAERLCVKCSPLFDVAEAFRIFGDCRVEVVSLHGECKEVNLYVDGSRPRLSAVAIGRGEFSTPYPPEPPAWGPVPADLNRYGYVTLPDAALLHARLVPQAFAGMADVWSDDGVALSESCPEGALGRTFAIGAVSEFDARRLRRELGGGRVEIYRRAFPMSNEEICRRLGVCEGGDRRWCFTRICGKNVAIRLEDAAGVGGV